MGKSAKEPAAKKPRGKAAAAAAATASAVVATTSSTESTNESTSGTANSSAAGNGLITASFRSLMVWITIKEFLFPAGLKDYCLKIIGRPEADYIIHYIDFRALKTKLGHTKGFEPNGITLPVGALIYLKRFVSEIGKYIQEKPNFLKFTAATGQEATDTKCRLEKDCVTSRLVVSVKVRKSTPNVPYLLIEQISNYQGVNNLGPKIKSVEFPIIQGFNKFTSHIHDLNEIRIQKNLE